jgi:hypothetical protein
MGIFRNITKTLKKAAPLIGASIGMYFGGPMGSAALGGALGGGIGSLVGGGDTDDALKAALLGGIGGYVSAGGNFTTAGQAASNASNVASNVASAPTVTGIESASANTGVSDFAINSSIPKYTPSVEPSMFDKALGFAKENPMLTTAGVGTLLGAASGGFDEEEVGQKETMRAYPVGKSRLGTGRIGNKLYNLDDPDERRQYFEDNRKRREPKTVYSAAGGEVNGPGTGTSDSVPARLSDGEFVVTAKAVRGAGGGDRNVGAARMYDIMSDLERVA